jgi:hypothetical protein
VTPSWTVAPDNLLYFKYSHGVKSGGFNTAATLPVALLAVEPEELDAFELGYKSQWFDRRLTFNATLFHYDYHNVQINVVGPNPGAVGGATVSYLQNASKAHVNGAEIELEARPVDGLTLTGAVGILDTKYDELQVVNGGADLSGARFVRAPSSRSTAARPTPFRWAKRQRRSDRGCALHLAPILLHYPAGHGEPPPADPAAAIPSPMRGSATLRRTNATRCRHSSTICSTPNISTTRCRPRTRHRRSPATRRLGRSAHLRRVVHRAVLKRGGRLVLNPKR